MPISLNTNNALYAGASSELPPAPENAIISFVYSGDYRKDALLAGLEFRWNNTADVGTNTTVTFSFPTTAPSYTDGSATAEEANGFQPFTEQQQDVVRGILTKLSAQVGLDFTEVADSASSYGMLRFGNNDQTAANSAGYAFLPNSNGESSGDVYISMEYSTDVLPGTYSYGTFVHELGHALGLKHPGNYNAGETTDTAVMDNFLGVQDDKTILTIMSYRESVQELQADWYAPYDIMTLRYLYGSRDYNSTDSTYILTDADGEKLNSIIDDGGSDTIDITALTSGASLNLNPASISSLGKTFGEASIDNLSIGIDTLIENVTGSAFADTITLNSASNHIDAGNGIDTIIFTDNSANHTFLRSDSAFIVNGPGSETDTLLNVERLKFADKNLAIDLNGNAGSIAKLLGAIFGKETVDVPQYVGIGLNMLDTGTSYEELMQLALNERLGSGFSNTDIVSLLFQNLAGAPPSDTDRDIFAGAISSGQYTQISLAVAAADHELNTNNINLVGLADTGLVYA